MENADKKLEGVLKFKLGAVVMTRGVANLVEEHGLEPIQYLARHARGDWGDIPDEDKATNEAALSLGSRVFSAYNLADLPQHRLWIITEADRSVTTFLLPSEY